jgi:hypothetical protein
MGTTSKKTVTRTPSAPARARRSSEEVSISAAPSSDEIAALAYRYFVESGYQQGNALDHWLRAETELRGR